MESLRRKFGIEKLSILKAQQIFEMILFKTYKSAFVWLT